MDDKAESPIEVYEWSVWVGNPAQPASMPRAFTTTPCPASWAPAGPSSKRKRRPSRFPLSPISVVQFFGDAARDIDVDLKVKKAHSWRTGRPATSAGAGFSGSSRILSNAPPPADSAELPAGDPLVRRTARRRLGACILKYESHFERFIAYDTELTLPIPLRIRGGPDEYTLQNLTGQRLLDVAIIVPTPEGYRVGWLDELPTAAPEEEGQGQEAERRRRQEESEKEKADAFFKEGEKKKSDDEPPPLPAEADATVKARVDQQLNRPVVVTVEKAPRRDVLDLITGQVRLRYELDDRTLAKADINLTQTTSMNANGIAARDALADLLGNLGLSYRVADDGRLFITTAARLSEDASKKGTVIEGPPVKLVMPPPMKASNPSYAEVTRHALARRTGRAGPARRRGARAFVSVRQGPLRAGELIVLVHLSRAAIDDAIVLDVFPPPKKLVRTALLVVHGVDPRLQDRARTLVQELGDQSPRVRDTAENTPCRDGARRRARTGRRADQQRCRDRLSRRKAVAETESASAVKLERKA